MPFWSLFCAESGSPRTDGGESLAILCPGFKLLPKDVGDEASDLVFQAGSIPREGGKDGAGGRQGVMPGGSDAAFCNGMGLQGNPYLFKKTTTIWNNPPHGADGCVWPGKEHHTPAARLISCLSRGPKPLALSTEQLLPAAVFTRN